MMASDGTGTQVDAWIINKCKVEMRGEELYNVVESHKKRGRKKTVGGTKEIEIYVRDPFLCWGFLQQC